MAQVSVTVFIIQNLITPKETLTMTTKTTLSQIPISIWMLGFVSLLMDISSEMIHSLLPMYMVTTLGASAFAVGMIEGLAESTACLLYTSDAADE